MTDDELTAAIREVRERVQNRTGSHLVLPDLMPLVHARDAAEAKVAAIGSVNPRPPGLVSFLIQAVKKMIARALDWHVREQVEFNRATMASTQAVLEVLNETNRALDALSAHLDDYSRQVDNHREKYEIYTLRSASELQASFQLQIRELRHAFDAARTEQERLIHSELRMIRQRIALPASATPAISVPAEPSPPAIDWLHFSQRFRGPEENVREHQRRYLARFQSVSGILDLGCGRGEFLEAARDAGLSARGIDAHPEFVALCRSKGLEAGQADIFEHLASLSDRSLGGVFCSHVIEHLEPPRLPALIQLLGQKMEQNAPIVFETPNARSVASLTTHFFIDPTHVRPVPAPLLGFYLEEAGFGAIESEILPPEGLDCAVYARKL